MRKTHIPIGTDFAWLTVLWPAPKSAARPQYECACACGRKITVFAGNLLRGNSKSCGCKKRELIRNHNLTHGNACIGKVSPEYKSFQKAKARCQNLKEINYENYGGRGIEFRFDTFEQFLAEVGHKPDASYSIDRIDNDGHYEIGNVKWSTPKEQANNRRLRKDSLSLR